MKCRKHTTDLTSLTGVCASCLRDRLLTIIQAQEQANQNNNTSSTPSDQSQSQPPQIQRPLNNKPRIQHTLSDQQQQPQQPHVAITNSGCIGHATSSSSKKNLIRFASFSNLFRSSHNHNHNHNNIKNYHPSVTSSPSIQRRRFVRNRGVSPVRSSDCENDDEFDDDESSEYESAESTSCKQTPQKTPLRRVNGGGGGGAGGWIFCLSPLVRARSPSRLWSMKGKGSDGGGGGGVVVPHLSYAKSFMANRSRKLADFGRSSTDPNR